MDKKNQVKGSDKNPNVYDDTFDRTRREQHSPSTTGIHRPHTKSELTYDEGDPARQNKDNEKTSTNNK